MGQTAKKVMLCSNLFLNKFRESFFIFYFAYNANLCLQKHNIINKLAFKNVVLQKSTFI